MQSDLVERRTWPFWIESPIAELAGSEPQEAKMLECAHRVDYLTFALQVGVGVRRCGGIRQSEHCSLPDRSKSLFGSRPKPTLSDQPIRLKKRSIVTASTANCRSRAVHGAPSVLGHASRETIRTPKLIDVAVYLAGARPLAKHPHSTRKKKGTATIQRVGSAAVLFPQPGEPDLP